jgi:hypothetical protein
MIRNCTTSTAAADANKKPERSDASNPAARKKNSGRQTGMQNTIGYAGRNTGGGQKRSEKEGGGPARGASPQATGRPGGLAGQTPTDERKTMTQDGSRWLKRESERTAGGCGAKRRRRGHAEASLHGV